jgi:hypothetical protein
MRTLLLVLFFGPTLAHAGVDFKCDSVRYEDQVGGWLRFASNGQSGSISLEYWNGYPPIALIDAAFAAPKAAAVRVVFTSDPDHYDETVAKIDLPASYVSEDKFAAKVELTGPDKKKLRYELSCVRH